MLFAFEFSAGSISVETGFSFIFAAEDRNQWLVPKPGGHPQNKAL
jgi:hypothetical protein